MVTVPLFPGTRHGRAIGAVIGSSCRIKASGGIRELAWLYAACEAMHRTHRHQRRSSQQERVPRMTMIRSSVTLVLCLLLAMSASAPLCAEPWGPWSVLDEAPVLFTAADREAPTAPPKEPQVQPIAATPFLWSIRFYQKFITHVDGDRCPMYPTCSVYSIQAFKKHGPVIGIVMTADRLMHELDEQRHVPLIQVGNRLRFDDPLSHNDFWWYKQ